MDPVYFHLDGRVSCIDDQVSRTRQNQKGEAGQPWSRGVPGSTSCSSIQHARYGRTIFILDLAPCLRGKRARSIGYYVCMMRKGFAVLVSVIGSCRVAGSNRESPCRVPGGERAVVHLVMTQLS